jgi:hypothetical protein
VNMFKWNKPIFFVSPQMAHLKIKIGSTTHTWSH